MHRVGSRPRGGGSAHRRRARRPVARVSKGSGPTSRWPTAQPTRTAPSPPRSWPASTTCAAAVAAGARPRPPRRQLGRRRSPGPRRATTSCASASPSTATCPSPSVAAAPSARPTRGRTAPPGPVAAGQGGRRARAGGRRAPLLRPAPPAARALGGGHRAARLRRRGAPGPVRGGLRGADRRAAPSAGRHGDDGPDRRRLRARTPPVAVGDEVVLIGRQGDEEITADEWAERLGHDQLRGALRHRPPGAPGAVGRARGRPAEAGDRPGRHREVASCAWIVAGAVGARALTWRWPRLAVRAGRGEPPVACGIGRRARAVASSARPARLPGDLEHHFVSVERRRPDPRGRARAGPPIVLAPRGRPSGSRRGPPSSTSSRIATG